MSPQPFPGNTFLCCVALLGCGTRSALSDAPHLPTPMPSGAAGQAAAPPPAATSGIEPESADTATCPTITCHCTAGDCERPDVVIEIDGPGLSGTIKNWRESTYNLLFEPTDFIFGFVRRYDKSRGVAHWSAVATPSGSQAAYFYGEECEATDATCAVETLVAPLEGRGEVQRIADALSFSYAPAVESALSAGRAVVFHHSSSDTFLALRIDRLYPVLAHDECCAVTSGDFSVWLLAGSRDFSSFVRR